MVQCHAEEEASPDTDGHFDSPLECWRCRRTDSRENAATGGCEEGAASGCLKGRIVSLFEECCSLSLLSRIGQAFGPYLRLFFCWYQAFDRISQAWSQVGT